MGGKASPYIRKSLWGNNASHRRGKIIRPERREFFHPVILRAAKITPTEERSDEHLIHLANLEDSGRDRLKVGRDKGIAETVIRSIHPLHCPALLIHCFPPSAFWPLPLWFPLSLVPSPLAAFQLFIHPPPPRVTSPSGGDNIFAKNLVLPFSNWARQMHFYSLRGLEFLINAFSLVVLLFTTRFFFKKNIYKLIFKNKM